MSFAKKVSFEPPALSSYKGNGERFYCFVLILKEKTYLEADGPYMLDVISIERSLIGLLFFFFLIKWDFFKVLVLHKESDLFYYNISFC